jgi:hypothetical protein
MFGTRTRRTLALFAPALICLLAFGSTGTTAAAEETRPLKGSLDGVVVGFIPPNMLVVEGAGEASHLGHFTRTEFLTLGEAGSISGTIIYTAANGDLLYSSFTGQFVSATTAVGLYTFAGGTGRFTNATGSATFEAVTPDFQNVHVEFQGTLTY